MSTRAVELTGPQKAAVLLLNLSREQASRVLASMTSDEVEDVTTEIVKMGAVEPVAVDVVMDEFYARMGGGDPSASVGGIDAARGLLESTFGRGRADALIDKLSTSSGRIPFGFLRDADARVLQGFLAGEHPQTIALVLAHLKADQASQILGTLPAELAGDVARRIGAMDRANPDVMGVVADALFRRSSSVLAPVQTMRVGGLGPLVEIINRADPGTEKVLLEGLDSGDPELAEQVRSQLFVFEAEDRAIQLVLRQVESSVLAKALKGVRDEVRDKVLGNVSERARENLLEEIELLGRMRLSEVEEARGAVVAVIRSLEASGEIVLRRGGDDDDDYVA